MDARQIRWDRRKSRPAAWVTHAAAVLLWSVLPGAVQAAERVALVIGNSAYEHVTFLPNPGNDAKAVGDAFERLGYTVMRLMDADYHALHKGVRSFKQAARGKDVAVVFYAGHGIGVGGSSFLVPVDAELGFADDVEDQAIPLTRLMSAVGNTRHLGLVILDACRDNPFVKSMKGETRSIERGLAPVETTGRTMVAYAAKDGQVALDGEDGDHHSPYTEALLKYLKEEPGLEVRFLFGKVRDAVEADTKKRFGEERKQVPWTYGDLGGRKLYLASAAVPPPPPKDTGTATAGGTPSSAAGDAARAYEAAERAGTVTAYRIVVGDFPNSTYAKLARAQIAKLEEKPKPIVVVGGDPEDDVAPVVPAPSPGEAARAYEAVERLDTVAAYRVFIRRFPGSYEAELARGHIAKLEGKPKSIIVAGGASKDEVPSAAPSPRDVQERLRLSLEHRRLVQMGLAAAGHDPGPVDGMLGGQTRRALRAWQESKEVEGTGYLTREQSEGLVALGREESERRRTEAERRAREERQRAEAERKEREAEERRLAEAERKAREAEERRKRARKPGDEFRDCPECPEMVVVPSGRFMMGSRSGGNDERPVHRVTIARPFAVGVYEVTFGEWDACVSGGGCGGYRPGDRGWGRGRRPVVNVSWNDAKAYVRWLSRKTGQEYRLLSESEWEYVARAGTGTEYWWGNGIVRNRANCNRCGSRWDGNRTAPVGSFSANAFGLYDVHGNVFEWVEDCRNGSYAGAPSDGSARESGDCSGIARTRRGGSWAESYWKLRSAYRAFSLPGIRLHYHGFRVARTLTP